MTAICVPSRTTRWTSILALALTLLGGGGTALPAQEPPDSVVPLDSVVVTVTRGSHGLGRTPFAVSVQGQRNLQLGNTGFSLEEALQGLPGVQVQNRYNYTVGERISIRGFGARAQFGVRGLKVLVDGIPATLADGQSTLDHLDIGSLGRAEIMRGPASAMYGNGGGGVLSFETAQPPDVPIRQEAKGVFGDNGLVRLQSTTSGTANGISYLVNVAHLSYDGFRTHPADPSELFGGADRLNVNAQMRTDLAGGLLRVTGNFFDLDGENAGQLNRADLEAGSLAARGRNVEQGTRKDVHQGQLGVAWSGPLGGVNARFSGWGLFRNLDNPIPPRVIDLERTAWGGTCRHHHANPRRVRSAHLDRRDRSGLSTGRPPELRERWRHARHSHPRSVRDRLRHRPLRPASGSAVGSALGRGRPTLRPLPLRGGGSLDHRREPG